MNIRFTDHAIKRIRERFGRHSKRKIPYDLLRKIGRVATTKRFRVRIDGVCYVCAKEAYELVIVTVFPR